MRARSSKAASREVKAAFKDLTKKVIRRRVVNEGVRIDGRGTTDLRPVTAEVGVIPTAHGSGLFQRGETQVLNVLTLGMPRMDQMLDTISPETKKRYMHHYNMPPYSNGETGRMGGTKRREVGHGMLAERALLPVVPSLEEWPYALRLVSEVLSSNGSTSMASVCASSLSLMDGGVPIKAPVAGIAMGLIYDDGKYVTLTDILGAEDAFGDMDFKVAGTADFVTALQLDTKIDGLPAEVLWPGAASRPRRPASQILEVMNATIAEPRPEVGATAPKVISFEIPIDKIGEVIGPKGKVINAIQQETGADISVDDDGMVGTVSIGSSDNGAVAEAERQIKLILNPPTADVGADLQGPRREHHQVRCVRQHPPGPRRPGPHLQDGWRQAHRQGRGRASPRRRDRGPGRRRRPERQGVADPDPGARRRQWRWQRRSDEPRSERRPPREDRGDGPDRSSRAGACSRDERSSPAVEHGAPKRCRSRTRSTPRSARSSATSVPATPGRGGGRGGRASWRWRRGGGGGRPRPLRSRH